MSLKNKKLSKPVAQATLDSLAHWDRILEIHTPADTGLKFFEAHCIGEFCPLCKTMELCTECPLRDYANRCCAAWEDAAEAAEENRLHRNHLLAVRNRIKKVSINLGLIGEADGETEKAA